MSGLTAGVVDPDDAHDGPLTTAVREQDEHDPAGCCTLSFIELHANKTSGYRPELDGLRALAILAVIGSHSGFRLTNGGWLGVDVFFVLSGYLITGLLLRERRRTGRVHLGHFFARRALRLYPALVVMCLVGFVFYPLLGDGGTLVGYLRTVATSLLYLQDFVSGLTLDPHGGFGMTWSLGVEEQFYLLWPPVLIWCLVRGRNPMWAAGIGIGVGYLLLALTTRPSEVGVPATYFLPWTRFPQLLAGCLVAIVLSRWTVPDWLRRDRAGWALGASAFVLVLVADRAARYPHLIWLAPAMAVVMTGMLAHLHASTTGPGRALSWSPLVFLGRRSYGLYLYQGAVAAILGGRLGSHRSVGVLVEFVVALALAVVSYRVVEKPFLRYKQRLSPQDRVPT